MFHILILTPKYLKLLCREKENKGCAHKALIALLLAGFSMTAVSTSTSAAANLIQVKSSLVALFSGGLIVQEMAATNLNITVISILEVWSEHLIFLIADTAIVWRAWALWAENKLITWTLLIILLGDIGVNTVDAIADTKEAIHSNSNSLTLDALSAAMNLTANIVATLLIAHRARIHDQSTHALLRNKKTQVEAILLLMVESGAFFGLVQVTSIIFSTLDIHAAKFSAVHNADSCLGVLYIYTAALNPVALIILIQTGNTYDHSFHLEDVTSVPNVG
ncbi:hypothetical protein BT96DRAFT_34241 [Gymnopus androsaceus JB14]|uniref:Uncharacterized protein n=1 Tax=Gymnopus androsaceus JB14 TaxID=1447944 RepID=A0A6A4GDF5_9AGAR|nr:hypothetical protein BT96DRAFT_34241 [Gymnopus androsaceus JB14]